MALWNSVKINREISIPTVAGLTPEESTMLAELLTVWNNKLHRNGIRNVYYNSKNKLKDLGISIPPRLRYIETVVGWPAKSVDVLAARSKFDGFTFSGDNIQTARFENILSDNGFKNMYSRLVTSELINSCS